MKIKFNNNFNARYKIINYFNIFIYVEIKNLFNYNDFVKSF